MWILQSVPDATSVVFRLPYGAVKSVGRASAADIVLDAALVSRLHCRLEANDQAIEVFDLSSTNGTFVNDKRVERASLLQGDRLRIGRVELYVAKAAASEAEAGSAVEPAGAGGSGI
jgi:pSer/pThr/pTyr-binding forkhead associated (FHA) protein